MYLNDVSAKRGLFNYLRRDKAGMLFAPINRYNRGEKISDADLGVFRNEFNSVEGPKGTVFDFDTRRVFYLGGSVSSGQQIIMVLSFLPTGI